MFKDPKGLRMFNNNFNFPWCLFFCAEVRQLSNPGLLSNMRSNLIDALTATAQKHHPQNWGYVPSLMLLLAHIRQASLQTIGHLQKLKNEGVVPFCDLLKEMLEAQSLPSEEKSALSQCG